MDDHTYRSAGRTGSGEAKFRNRPGSAAPPRLAPETGGIATMFVRGNLIWERPMKRHPDPNSRDWEQIAEDLQQTADSLPPGDDKQAAEQKLQRTKRAVEIRNRLTSPRVRPPR